MSVDEWPTTCEVCGTELQTVQVSFEEGDFSDGLSGVLVVQDFCPNPDCERHNAELAAARSGQSAPDPAAPDPAAPEPAAPEPAAPEPDRPGSLGGDNGGA